MIVPFACFGVLLVVFQRIVNAIPGEIFEKGFGVVICDLKTF